MVRYRYMAMVLIDELITKDRMEAELPLVSIGVAVFNEERFLTDALASLLAQDYANIEVVISDNGSDDRTADICREFAARDPRIRYHRESENRGSTANFNHVLALSSGEYFTWGSGHDLRLPSAITSCVNVLEQRPNVVLCYPRTLMVSANGSTLFEMDDEVDTTGMSRPRRLRHLIRRLSAGNAVYGVIRTSALRSSGGLQAQYWSDLALLSELSMHGEFHQIPESLFLRRENRSGETRADAVKRQLAMMDPRAPEMPPRHPLVAKARTVLIAARRGSAPTRPIPLLAARVVAWTIGARVRTAMRSRVPGARSRAATG
jgi:hypothetical protein